MAGLYGDWETMAEPEAPKKKKKKRKVIKGEDYAKTAESKAGVKKYQRRDRPYKGYKSDLAWIEKQKEKKKKRNMRYKP